MADCGYLDKEKGTEATKRRRRRLQGGSSDRRQSELNKMDLNTNRLCYCRVVFSSTSNTDQHRSVTTYLYKKYDDKTV